MAIFPPQQATHQGAVSCQGLLVGGGRPRGRIRCWCLEAEGTIGEDGARGVGSSSDSVAAWGEEDTGEEGTSQRAWGAWRGKFFDSLLLGWLRLLTC